MKESFFGKQYDVPEGMSPKNFEAKLLDWNTKMPKQIENSIEKLDATGMFLRTKELIKGISLKIEFLNEENQTRLEERKAVALKLLDDLMNENGYIARYASSINRFNKANLFGEDRNQEEFLRMDNERRLSHNALMEHIRMTIRYIREQFSALPEDDIDDIEEKLKYGKHELLPIERVEFPAGKSEKIFLPRYANLDQRETITRWVEDIRNGFSLRTLK